MESRLKKKVLIIDDESDFVDVLAFRLDSMGCMIDVALCGEVGLEKAKTFHPDVILLDVMMSGINGFEVCKRLRAAPDTSAIPVVIMTAFISLELKEEATRAGASKVLLKPFPVSEIIPFIS